MTTQYFTETIGNLEYCLFPASNDRAAYATVNRCLVKNPAEDSDIAIADTICRDGIDYPVTEIAQKAFSDAAVECVHVPESITAIRSLAFLDSKISGITGCQGVKIIEHGAFSRCIKLTGELSFPKVEHIHSLAFQFSTISAITLPPSLQDMAYTAFQDCRNMKQLTMHGTTKITYNPELEIYAPFLHYSTILNLKPPFKNLRLTGNCLVSADKTVLYHVVDTDDGELRIPGSINRIVGTPFHMVSCNTLVFLNAKGAKPLWADLSEMECTEFTFLRPMNIEGVPTDGDVTLHCHNSVRLLCEVDVATIYIYKGATLSAESDTSFSSSCIVYKEGVKEVDAIYHGTTEIGPDVKKVNGISLDSDLYCDPEEPKYTVIMHCATPPEIEVKKTKVFSTMELRVPRGCLDAYTKHPVWKKCALITDGTRVAVDRFSKRRIKAKKEHMTETMALDYATKYAKMLFGPSAHILNYDTYFTLTLDLDISAKSVNRIMYSKEIPVKEVGDPNTWDAIEAEVNNIKDFLASAS